MGSCDGWSVGRSVVASGRGECAILNSLREAEDSGDVEGNGGGGSGGSLVTPPPAGGVGGWGFSNNFSSARSHFSRVCTDTLQYSNNNSRQSTA